MTVFEDLTPCEYGGRDGSLAIGWLGQACPTGPVPSRFVRRVKAAARKPLRLTRGFHECEMCTGPDRARGNGELRFQSRTGTVYSSPALLPHYITDHDYLPPAAFVQAVLSGRVLRNL